MWRSALFSSQPLLITQPSSTCLRLALMLILSEPGNAFRFAIFGQSIMPAAMACFSFYEYRSAVGRYKPDRHLRPKHAFH